jgi:hypothetical protein
MILPTLRTALVATTLQVGAFLPAAMAQTSNCNDQSRTKQITAGQYNLASKSCATVSFSVGGLTVTTPSTCATGFTMYRGTVYSCGPASTGTHCNANGYKVYITFYSGGDCPNLAGLVGGSYSSWADVPQALQKALNCVPPKAETPNTFDWSASVTSCATVQPPAGVGVVETAVNGDTFVLHQGDFSSVVSAPEHNPFSTAFDAAQSSDPAVLPPLLAAAYQRYSPLAAASVTAEVTISEAYGSAAPHARRAIRIEGVVRADGRFDLVLVEASTVEGQPATLADRLVFDGSVLMSLTEGGETGSVYPTSYTGFDRTFAALCGVVGPIHDWLARPLHMPVFEGASYAFEPGSAPSEQRARRFVPFGSGTMCSEEHLIRTVADVSSIASTALFDAAGNAVDTWTFAEDAVVAPGIVRPKRVHRTVCLDAAPTGRRVDVDLSVLRAQSLDASAAVVPSPAFASDQLWQIWL